MASHSNSSNSQLAIPQQNNQVQLLNPSGTFQPPAPRIPKKVIDEDEYLDKMEQIIKRDYFPYLLKVEALEEYRRNGSDKDKFPTALLERTPMDNTPDDPLQRITDRLREKHSSSEDSSKQKKNKSDIDNLSLDSYLSKFTSDDNESFNKLQDLDKEKFKQKYWWVFKQEEDASRKNALAIEYAGNSDIKAITAGAPAQQIAKYEGHNNFYFRPYGQDVISFDDIEDKIGPAKQIKKANTRLPTEFFVEQMKKDRESRYKKPEKEEVPGFAANEYGSMNGLRTPDLRGVKREGKKDYYNLDEMKGHVAPNKNEPTPMVKGYRILREEAPEAATPLMTWGNIEGEPMLLSSAPINTYRVPESSKREELTHELVSKINDRNRRKKQSDKKDYKSISDFSKPAQRLISSVKRTNSIMREGVRDTPLMAKRQKTETGERKVISLGVKTPLLSKKDDKKAKDSLKFCKCLR